MTEKKQITLNGCPMTLKFGLLSLRAMERDMGIPFPQMIVAINSGHMGIDILLSIIWAGLLWQNRTLTVEQVGEWLDAEDGESLEQIMTTAANEFVASFEHLLVKPKREQEGTSEKN